MSKKINLSSIVSTEETVCNQSKEKFKFPQLSKLDYFDQGLSDVGKSLEANNLFKTFYEDTKTRIIKYQDFKAGHQSRRNRFRYKSRGSSNTPELIFSPNRAESRFSMIVRKTNTNGFSLSEKRRKLVRKSNGGEKLEKSSERNDNRKYFSFDVQPKVVPPAKPKLNLGNGVGPAITFGDKLWRLTQLAALNEQV